MNQEPSRDVFRSFPESPALRDLHVHTVYCDHAVGEMEEYVLAGLALGLEEIGFLEHVEAPDFLAPRRWMTDKEIPLYWEAGRRLQGKYAGLIKVGLGLEVGVSAGNADRILEMIAGRTWDRIGLSCHLVPYQGRFLNISSRSSLETLKTADHKELTLDYYRTLRDHLPIFRPDFVCHLDVPRKFMTDLTQDPDVFALIREVLEEMASVGAALEVNTSGVDWVGQAYPGDEILRTAWSLGLGLVMNSDSHHPSQVGRHFERTVERLKNILGGVPSGGNQA